MEGVWVLGRHNADIARYPASKGGCHGNHFLVFGRPFVKRFALCYQSVVCLSCLSCAFLCPVLSVILVYGGQAVRWIKTKLGVQVSLRAGHIVLEGYQLPFCKRGRAPAPIFGPYPLWPNGWMEQGATW